MSLETQKQWQFNCKVLKLTKSPSQCSTYSRKQEARKRSPSCERYEKQLLSGFYCIGFKRNRKSQDLIGLAISAAMFEHAPFVGCKTTAAARKNMSTEYISYFERLKKCISKQNSDSKFHALNFETGAVSAKRVHKTHRELYKVHRITAGHRIPQLHNAPHIQEP